MPFKIRINSIISILFVLSMFFAVSCGDDDDNNPVNNTGKKSAVVTCKISGSYNLDYIDSTVSYTVADLNTDNAYSVLVNSLFSNNDIECSLNIKIDDSSLGDALVFDLAGASSPKAIISLVINEKDNPLSNDGFLNITEGTLNISSLKSGTLAGSFSFKSIDQTGTKEITVSEGTIDIK